MPAAASGAEALAVSGSQGVAEACAPHQAGPCAAPDGAGAGVAAPEPSELSAKFDLAVLPAASGDMEPDQAEDVSVQDQAMPSAEPDHSALSAASADAFPGPPAPSRVPAPLAVSAEPEASQSASAGGPSSKSEASEAQTGMEAPMTEPAMKAEPRVREPAMDYYGLPINDFQPLPDAAAGASPDMANAVLPDPASPATAGEGTNRTAASSGGASQHAEHAGRTAGISNGASVPDMVAGPTGQSPSRSSSRESSLPEPAAGGGNASPEGAAAHGGGNAAVGAAEAAVAGGGGGGNAAAARTPPSTLIIRDWGSMGGGFVPFGSSPAILKLPAKGGRVRAVLQLLLTWHRTHVIRSPGRQKRVLLIDSLLAQPSANDLHTD